MLILYYVAGLIIYVTLPVNVAEKFNLAVEDVILEAKTLTSPSVEATTIGGDENPAVEKLMSKKSTPETLSAQVNIVKKGILLINLVPQLQNVRVL